MMPVEVIKKTTAATGKNKWEEGRRRSNNYKNFEIAINYGKSIVCFGSDSLGQKFRKFIMDGFMSSLVR